MENLGLMFICPLIVLVADTTSPFTFVNSHTKNDLVETRRRKSTTGTWIDFLAALSITRSQGTTVYVKDAMNDHHPHNTVINEVVFKAKETSGTAVPRLSGVKTNSSNAAKKSGKIRVKFAPTAVDLRRPKAPHLQIHHVVCFATGLLPHVRLIFDRGPDSVLLDGLAKAAASRASVPRVAGGAPH